MELKEALVEVRKGKIVFDGEEDMKYFLFMGSNEKLYYLHNETITLDKMKIAELKDSQPDLLAKNWWENKWEVWDTSSTKTEEKTK